ncbi:22736_t:CDS:2 [Gigaspora margarita]|uniref:22736_t:CDS:1 n=1 Tax=Gigaspora margarita TaxID=4874 RepID=A0ABN7WSA9_GIGMA|nr:22736_t:CDS:2 [Gigaspora margarita]
MSCACDPYDDGSLFNFFVLAQRAHRNNDPQEEPPAEKSLKSDRQI